MGSDCLCSMGRPLWVGDACSCDICVSGVLSGICKWSASFLLTYVSIHISLLHLPRDLRVFDPYLKNRDVEL